MIKQLIEGNKLNLNANDQAAKDFAVQSTLNRLKGIRSQPLVETQPQRPLLSFPQQAVPFT